MPLASPATTRRDFVRLATAAAASLPFSLRAQTTANPHTERASDHGNSPNPTSDAALKFSPAGQVLPFAGNTVICHVPPQSRFLDGLAALRASLLAAPFADKLAILPVPSYHMTVFPGANDQARERSSWPGGVPLDAPIATCTQVLRDRLRSVRLPAPPPFRVTIDVPRTISYGRACTMRMRGADAAAEHALRQTRSVLADAWQFHAPDQSTYAFHITLAYTMHDLAPAEHTAYRTLLEQHVPRIAATTPVLELGLPEFCTFDDMTRFTPELLIGC